MEFIDYLDSRPIYEQIADRYKTLILSGALPPDEQLPSVRKLSMELSTNPNTIQKAFSVLERDGFIYTVRSRGNFVRGNDELKDKKREELKEKLRELFKEAETVGIAPEELIEEVRNDDKA